VPTLLVTKKLKAIRFAPYYDWLHHTTVEEFVNEKYNYSLINPTPNLNKHIETRDKLIKDINSFVQQMKNDVEPLEKHVKTTYTDDDVMKWQNEVMRQSLDNWLIEYRREMKEITKQIVDMEKEKKSDKKALKDNEEKIELYKETIKNNKEAIKNRKQIEKQLRKDIEEKDKKIEHQSKILNYRSIKFVVKLRSKMSKTKMAKTVFKKKKG